MHTGDHLADLARVDPGAWAVELRSWLDLAPVVAHGDSLPGATWFGQGGSPETRRLAAWASLALPDVALCGA